MNFVVYGRCERMNKSIALICPYFGAINKSIHALWLQGCAANPDITFLLLTDDKQALEMPMPDNAKGIFMSWGDCVALIKSKFDFDVALNNPYKLCDYRPAFGYIFADYITGFDFWGHTDSGDTLYGDLRKFLTDGLLNEYDKIHIVGHMTLYRNTDEANMRFAIPAQSGLTIQDILTVDETVCFDDMYQKASINRLYQENGFSLLERVANLVADIYPSKYAFQIVEDNGEKIPRVFEWDYGKLFDVTVHNGELNRREIGYVHFQKRKMVSEVPDGTDHFYMIPNRFVPATEPLTCEIVEAWSRDKLYLDPLKGRAKRILNYAKHPEVFMRKVREKMN